MYDFNSVVSEELLFRGLILHFLIKYWKTRPAMLVSASVFGIYHWFTFGVWGNLAAMVLVFVVILTNKNAFAICIYVEGNVPNWDSILEENCEYRLGSYITLSN